MKKTVTVLMATLVIASSFTSCATLFGGKVDSCQTKKPGDGGQTRKIRVGALIADIILFTPSLIVDFATNAIYKPCGK